MTRIDLTKMLMVDETEMFKNTSEAEMLIGSNSKISMDIVNDGIGGPKKYVSFCFLYFIFNVTRLN